MSRLIAVLIVWFSLGFAAQAQMNIQQVTSPGGIKAWLVEERSIPFIALDIRFKGGTSLDLPGKRGATYMMSGLLEEGAGDLDAAGFSRASDTLAARFSFDAYGDAVAIKAKFLSETQGEAMDLLRLAVQQPSFSEVAIDRVRAQVISIIAGDLKDPQSVASDAFDKMAYGDHPYGTASTGTADSVNLLDRQDIIDAYKGAMAKDRMFVSAVGDISAADLGLLLDKLLGDLPEQGAAFPPPAEVAITGGTTVIKMPTPQSTAIFGQKGIKRDDPDFFAAYVMNQVFGSSGFTSRLSQEVREKRGLTYGVYTYLASYDLAELYMGSVASANDKIAEAIGIIRAEWAKMAEGGVTATELEAAKKYLTGAYALRFDGNARIASILVAMQMDDLPVSYLATRNDKVNAVSLEDVARVAKRLLRPEDLRVVVVGAPIGITSSD